MSKLKIDFFQGWAELEEKNENRSKGNGNVGKWVKKTFFVDQTTISNVEFRYSTLKIVVGTIKNVFQRSNNNFQRWKTKFNVGNCCLIDEKLFFTHFPTFPFPLLRFSFFSSNSAQPWKKSILSFDISYTIVTDLTLHKPRHEHFDDEKKIEIKVASDRDSYLTTRVPKTFSCL